jgi:hypothetical protein
VLPFQSKKSITGKAWIGMDGRFASEYAPWTFNLFFRLSPKRPCSQLHHSPFPYKLNHCLAPILLTFEDATPPFFSGGIKIKFVPIFFFLIDLPQANF